LVSSPWIRRSPHSGFSLASRTAIRAMPRTVGGRQGRRRVLVPYFRALVKRVVLELCHGPSVAAYAVK